MCIRDSRTVASLARESPALAVTIYNKNAFTAAQLDELSAIKKQIVSLNLNRMPVQDADLKKVGTLENLRKLDLNFTEISSPFSYTHQYVYKRQVLPERDELWPNHQAESERSSRYFKPKTQEEIRV